MNLPDFDYYEPESLQETCELLARLGSKAKVISGGTDMMVKMKHGLMTPEVLVSIKNLSQLSNISYEKGKGVVIGACATHNDITASPLLQEKYISLCEAAHHMANNQTAAESNPISDIRGSAEYRRDMVRVFTKRALSKAISEGHV